jgi:uncharacterized RmlC-like cupin family protein
MGETKIHVVRPDQFNLGTAQTPGSERRAAIAPELGVNSAIWGGIFEVEPGARTGDHHHGRQDAFLLQLTKRGLEGDSCSGRQCHTSAGAVAKGQETRSLP